MGTISTSKVIVTTSVEPELRDWFDAKAKTDRRTRSELLRFAAEEYRERHAAESEEAAA